MQHKKLNNKFIMSTPSVRTWPIRTVQVQMGSMAHPMREKFIVFSALCFCFSCCLLLL